MSTFEASAIGRFLLKCVLDTPLWARASVREDPLLTFLRTSSYEPVIADRLKVRTLDLLIGPVEEGAAANESDVRASLHESNISLASGSGYESRIVLLLRFR